MEFKTSCAYSQGRSHRRNDTPCQDRAECHIFENSCLAIVTDGAGSKAEAEKSAEICCRITAEFFSIYDCSLSAEEIGNILTDKLNLGFEDEYGYINTNDYGSTLLFVFADNEGRCVVGHVGDGAVFLKKDGLWQRFSEPENGRFINETFFVPTEDLGDHLRISTVTVSQGDCFILTSDGLSELLYDETTETPAEACEIMNTLVREKSSSESRSVLENEMENYFSEYTADDMSVAVIALV